MRVFKEKELRLLTTLVCQTEKSLLKNMDNFLRNKYATVISTDEYIFAVGDIPVCLVAHVDTVAQYPPTELYYDKEKDTILAGQCAGFDDRCGVYAILKLINRGYRPSIILTMGEERGGIGISNLIDRHRNCPFPGVKYFLEIDRQGRDDCVFYYTDCPEFQAYIEKFGFKTQIGSYTDIVDISAAWKIVSVNVSAGYENEHTTSEKMHPSWLMETIDKISLMLDDVANAPYFEYKEIERYFKGFFPSEEEMCFGCGRYFDENELILAKTYECDEFAPICPDCMAQDVCFWCEICGDPVFIEQDHLDRKICKDCEEEVQKYERELRKNKEAI